MEVRNVTQKALTFAYGKRTVTLASREEFMVHDLDPVNTRQIGDLIREGKLKVLSLGDIEDYSFNPDAPEDILVLKEMSDIEDTFSHIKFKKTQ